MEARDSNGKKIAQDKLAKLVAVGKEAQKSVIKTVLSRSIVDKLVYPTFMRITYDSLEHALKLEFGMDKQMSNVLSISDHALGQLCKVLEIPKVYLNKLMSGIVGMEESRRFLLVKDILTEHLQGGKYLDRKKEPAKFLNRIVGNTLWAFLSRSYNRKLGTAAMLRPFLEQCAAHDASPTSAASNELKTSITCMLPIVFEPVDGEFVAFGVTYANSDFGKGSLTVSGTILRIASGTSAVTENGLRKIHLGALIQDSDIELSEETMDKESQAHMSAVKDTVVSLLSSENIQKHLDLIRFAAEKKLPLHSLEKVARDVLTKDELEELHKLLGKTKAGVIDLPPVTVNKDGDPEANAWWAAAALGIIAADVKDVARKVSIQ